MVVLPHSGVCQHVRRGLREPGFRHGVIYTTLRNAFQTKLGGGWNILFQSLLLAVVAAVVVFRNGEKRNVVRRVFNIYVAASYAAFAFIIKTS